MLKTLIICCSVDLAATCCACFMYAILDEIIDVSQLDTDQKAKT